MPSPSSPPRSLRQAVFSWDIVLLATLAVTVWFSIASKGFHPAVALITFVLCTLAEILGSVVVAWFFGDGDEAARRHDGVLAFVLGLFGLQFAAILSIIVLRINALYTGILLGIAITALGYLHRRRHGFIRPGIGIEARLMLVGVAIFVGIWSLQNLQSRTFFPDRVISQPWLDAFPHAMWISHFAHQSGAHLLESPMLARTPLFPYHYAGYAFPALITRFAGLSAYDAAVGLFATVPLFLTGIVAFLFGCLAKGPRTGLLTALAVVAIPDASYYVFNTRWNSYFFFQQIAGSGAHGAALLGLAWYVGLRGARDNRRPAMILSLLLAGVVFAFKSQIFLAYSFPLLGFIIVSWPKLSRNTRITLLSVATAVLVAALWGMSRIPHAPTFEFGVSGITRNLWMVVSHLPPVFLECTKELPNLYWRGLLIVVPLVTLALLGAWAVGMVTFTFSSRVRETLSRPLRWFPWIIFVNFAIITFGIRENKGSYGDPFEVIHKTFVWPYLAIAMWASLALAIRFRIEEWPSPRRFLAGVGIGALILIPIDVACARNLQSSFVYPGSGRESNITIPIGAYMTADYIRQNTPHDAVYQFFSSDPFLVFVGLSERHEYVADLKVNIAITDEVTTRQRRVYALLALPSFDAVVKEGKKLGLSYLIIDNVTNPPWARAQKPLYEKQGFRVYRI